MNRTVIFLVIVLLVGLAQADNFDRFCANAVDGQFVASPRSCQHWLYCQNGAATEGQCPNQYYFDEPIQMCRYPEYVNCNIGSVDFTCPSNDFQLFPHPKECGQYVACINGRAQEMDCAPGLYFDSSRNLCDLPANTDCHVEEPEPELIYYCEPGATYVTSHPNNCQKFILCVNEDRRVKRCADGLLFDPVNLRCDFAANVQCSLPEKDIDTDCDPAREFYYAPHPTNCEYYIVCISGHGQIERCANGLIFDWINLRCEMPVNAWCLAPPRG